MNVESQAAPRPRSADAVMAWLLYVLQLGGEALLAPLWLMSVMAGDSCGSVIDEPRVCDGNYFVTWFFGYAGVLLVAAVATPIAIVIAGRRGRWRWPWPVVAIALLVAATVVYVYALSR